MKGRKRKQRIASKRPFISLIQINWRCSLGERRRFLLEFDFHGSLSVVGTCEGPLPISPRQFPRKRTDHFAEKSDTSYNNIKHLVPPRTLSSFSSPHRHYSRFRNPFPLPHLHLLLHPLLHCPSHAHPIHSIYQSSHHPC